MSLWWPSFADAERPTAEQLLGVAIVEGADIAAAIKAAWGIGCNPGGEVQGMVVDSQQLARLSFQLPTGKLLGPAEARELADRVDKELGS